jgi:hypothetical protein
MKITPEHYAQLENGIHAVLAAHPTVKTDYAAQALSDMRLNWDLLRAAKINGKSGITWVCDELYSYLNDAHIGTALAKIVGNSGTNSNGKR